jgi:hypothetical protein
MTQLEQILVNNSNLFGIITDYNYRNQKVSIFDLTRNNPNIVNIDTTNPLEFTKYKF